MPELLTLDRRDDGVAVVTLANGKVNALSRALVTELHEAAIELSGNPPGAVVITGGDRIFAAGSENGLVFRSVGDHILGFAPALTYTASEFAQMFARLRKTLDTVLEARDVRAALAG